MMLEGATGRERVEEAAASELAARLSDTANSFWFIPIEAPTIASAMMPVHRRGPRVKMRTSIRGRAAASSDKRPLLVAGCCFWVVLATTVACLLVSPTIFAANQAAAKNAPSSQHLEQRHEALRIATATSTKQPAAMQENKGSLLQVKEAEEEEEEEGAVYRQQRTSSSLFEERPRIGPPARPSVSNSNDNNKRRPAKSLLAAASAAAIQDRQRQLANEQGEEEKEKTKEMRQTRRVRSSSSAESTTDLGHSTGERFNRRQWRGGGSRVWTGRPPSTSFWSRAQLANEFDESEANTDVDDDNNNNDVGVSINQVADKQQQQRRRLQTPGEHQVRRRPRGALQATPEALAHMPAASSANKTDSFGSGNGGAGAQAREDDDGGEPVTVINGMLRGQVILKCNLKPRERDSDEVSLILWYKDNSMVPIFSVDARASPVLEARHKPGAWLEGRSSLRIVEEEDGNDENEANGENQQQHRGHEAGLGWGATSIPAASSKRARPRFRRRPSDNDDLEEKVYHKAETPSSSSSSPSASPPSSFFSPEQWPRLSENLARLESAWSPFGSNRRQARRSVAVSADQDDENEDEARQTVVIHEQLPEAAARLSEPTKMGAANGTPNRSPSSASRDKHLVAHLLVDSLSSEDNGFYKCRVDFRRSRSRVEQLELKIIVPAEKPLIRDLTSGTPGGRLVKNNLAGPHDESSRVLLECETSGGYPEPSVTWWRNGRLVDDSYEIVSATDGSVLERRAGSGSSTGAPLDAYDELADGTRPIPQAPPQPVDAEPYQLGGGGGGPRSHEPTMADARQQSAHSTGQREQQQQQQGSQTGAASAQANRLIRNRLELVGLTRDDLLANYSCQASNSKLGDPPTSYVMIDMNLRPIRVQIENERQPVLAGKPIEIVCRAYGSRPAALISWHLNKSRLVGGGASDGGPAGSGTNSGGGSSSIVMDSSSGATDTSVGSGSSSVQQITESISSDSNITTSVLSFTPQIEHTGKLLACRATNELIANRANQQQLQQQQHTLPVTASPSLAQLEDTWKLEVHYLPRVRLALGEKLANRQAVQVGHDVYFECATQAEPPVHELRWWFNGKELETNVSQGVIISNQSLVLQRVGRHQRGKYTCSAMNSVGESRSNSVQLRIQHEPYCQDTSPLTHKGTQFGGGGHGTSANLIDDDDNNSNYDDHLMFGADEGARLRNTNNHPMMTSGGRRAQIHHKSHYGAARSESVRVYCHVEADPSEPISYKWAFVAKGQQQQQQSSSASATRPSGVPTTSSPNGSAGRPEWSGQQVVYLNSSLYSSAPDNNPLVSVLVYTPKSELDYGTLLCWAQNSLGQQQEPCVYRVVPAERPEPLRNCRLLNATDSQLAIGCEPGYDGGIDQSFHMEVYEANRPDQLVANLTNIAGLTDTGILPFGWQRHPSNGSSSGEFQDDSADDSLLTSISSNSDLDLYDAEAAQQQQQTTTTSSQRGQQQQQLAAASLISSETALASNNSSRQQKQRHSNHQPAHQRPPKSHSLANNGQLPNTEAIFLTEPQLAPATNYLITVYSANSKGASKPIAFTASTSNQSVAGGDLRLSNGMGPGSSLLAGREGRRSPIMNVDQTSALINEVLSLTWSPFLLVCAVTVLIFVLFASITFALIKYVDLTALVGSPTNGPTGSGGGGSSGQLRDGHTAATRHNQSPGKASALSSTLSGSTSGSGSGGGASNAGSHYGTTGGNHNQQPSLCLANEFVGDDDGQLTAVTTSQRDEDFGDAGDGRHSIELPALKPRQPTGQQDQHFMSATLGRPPVALAGNPGQAGLARVIAMGGLGGASSNWPTTINSSTASRAELEIPLNGMPLNTKRASLLDGSYLRAKIQQLTTANSNAGQQQQQQQQLSIGYASGGGQPISKMKQSNSDNFLNQTELGVTGGQPDFTSTTGGANNWFQCRTPHYQAAYWASCGGTLPRPLPFGYQNNSNNNHVGQQQQQGQANHYLDMEAPAYGYLKLVSNSGQQQQQLLSSAIHNNHHHHHHAAEHSPGGQHFELPAAQAIQSTGGVGADLASMAAFTFNNNNQVSASPSVNLAPAQTTLNCSTMANNTASNSGGSPMEHLLISGKQYIHQTRPIPFNEQHQHQQLQLTSQQQQRPGAVSSSSGTSMASRPSGGHHHQQQIGPCCQVAANGHNDDGPPVSCQTPQAVLFHTNAQTTNCCLVANGDHQQQQQNLTPKTSDLGDDVNDDDYDDEQDVLHGGLEMGDTTIIRGGGQFGACSASSECGQYQTIGANGPNNTFGATDSDGISSQGTQKSSSNLTNNTNNPPTSTTLGSPSSGFATEPCCNEQSTMAATWRQPDQQQQQHRTSQLKGSHHQQDQQIVTTCDASSKSATKLAGARNTRKSLVLDSYDDHYNHAPINYDTNNNNTDINNNNNNNLAQFYLLSDDHPETTTIQHSSNSNHASSTTLIRLANKSRVRLVTPTSQQQANHVDDDDDGDDEPPPIALVACNQTTNNYNHQPSRLVSHHARQSLPKSGTLSLLAPNGTTATIDDLATPPCDLQTDV